jgi:hypothetical protein
VLCASSNKALNLGRANCRQGDGTGAEPPDEQRADLAAVAVTCGGREAARLHEMMVERGDDTIDRGRRSRGDGPLGARGWENREQLPKRRARGGHRAQTLPSTATAREMPRQELVYNAAIDVRDCRPSARQPATEVLDGTDILLDRDTAVATVLEVADVGAEDRRQGTALQSYLNMLPFKEFLDHRRLPSAQVRRESHEDYAQLVNSTVSTRALQLRGPGTAARTLRITGGSA